MEIEVEGVKGSRCVELTQAIENLIGKVGNRFLKNDFYRSTKTEQSIHLKRFENETLSGSQKPLTPCFFIPASIIPLPPAVHSHFVSPQAECLAD